MDIIYPLGIFVKSFFVFQSKKMENNCLTPLPSSGYIGGMKTPKPLSIKIPGEYADKLGLHFTTLSKINAGTRQISLDRACLLLVMSKGDQRLKGLSIYDLRPDLQIAKQFLKK